MTRTWIKKKTLKILKNKKKIKIFILIILFIIFFFHISYDFIYK